MSEISKQKKRQSSKGKNEVARYYGAGRDIANRYRRVWRGWLQGKCRDEQAKKILMTDVKWIKKVKEREIQRV